MPGTEASIRRLVGDAVAGSGITRGELPGVMLPSTTGESAPVQEGTFAGRPCIVKKPMRAKA